MTFNFEIAIICYDHIEVRWPRPFGRVEAQPYQALAQCLLQVDGVNKVEVMRYTAQLHVAPQVESLGMVVQYIQAALLENADLARALANECGVVNYGAVVLPDVIKRVRTR